MLLYSELGGIGDIDPSSKSRMGLMRPGGNQVRRWEDGVQCLRVCALCIMLIWFCRCSGMMARPPSCNAFWRATMLLSFLNAKCILLQTACEEMGYCMEQASMDCAPVQLKLERFTPNNNQYPQR